MPGVLSLSATELTQQFRQSALSPVEVLEAALACAETVQARLNPFRLLDAEPAREAARASERRWAEGEPLSALDGVPVAIKDNQAVAGQTCAFGSRANQHLPPATEDAPHVARLREAGAVLYARTTMPDFAWKAVTDSPLTGVTRNPWDPALTPGGSSGGSAVAVATRCTPIATGSDGGGSIRIPAAFTGIYGIKPTTGRVPGVSESPDISAIGPLTRTVADAALALSVMCRPDRGDPLAAALMMRDFVAETGRGVEGLRVAVSATCGYAILCDGLRGRLRRRGGKNAGRAHDPARPRSDRDRAPRHDDLGCRGAAGAARADPLDAGIHPVPERIRPVVDALRSDRAIPRRRRHQHARREGLSGVV